jgi:hypothetical protein
MKDYEPATARPPLTWREFAIGGGIALLVYVLLTAALILTGAAK